MFRPPPWGETPEIYSDRDCGEDGVYSAGGSCNDSDDRGHAEWFIQTATAAWDGELVWPCADNGETFAF